MRRYLCIAIITVMTSCASDTPEYKFDYICLKNDTPTVYSFARSFVTKHLLSPASAEFPSILSGDVDIRVLKTDRDSLTCEFSVKGYVDAQNGFGALIRTNYFVKLKFEAQSAKWTLINISL